MLFVSYVNFHLLFLQFFFIPLFIKWRLSIVGDIINNIFFFFKRININLRQPYYISLFWFFRCPLNFAYYIVNYSRLYFIIFKYYFLELNYVLVIRSILSDQNRSNLIGSDRIYLRQVD